MPNINKAIFSFHKAIGDVLSLVNIAYEIIQQINKDAVIKLVLVNNSKDISEILRNIKWPHNNVEIVYDNSGVHDLYDECLYAGYNEDILQEIEGTLQNINEIYIPLTPKLAYLLFTKQYLSKLPEDMIIDQEIPYEKEKYIVLHPYGSENTFRKIRNINAYKEWMKKLCDLFSQKIVVICAKKEENMIQELMEGIDCNIHAGDLSISQCLTLVKNAVGTIGINSSWTYFSGLLGRPSVMTIIDNVFETGEQFKRSYLSASPETNILLEYKENYDFDLEIIQNLFLKGNTSDR